MKTPSKPTNKTKLKDILLWLDDPKSTMSSDGKDALYTLADKYGENATVISIHKALVARDKKTRPLVPDPVDPEYLEFKPLNDALAIGIATAK